MGARRTKGVSAMSGREKATNKREAEAPARRRRRMWLWVNDVLRCVRKKQIKSSGFFSKSHTVTGLCTFDTEIGRYPVDSFNDLSCQSTLY